MSPRKSVLAMAVLSMLSEEPMHAYRMQQLVKERHKDDVVNIAARNSIYQTIDRLLRDGLIEIASTVRSENRPERTVYQLTSDGRAALRDWLDTMLSTPAREFPEFPAALAFITTFDSADVLPALRSRVDRLEQAVSTLDNELTQGATFLPRIFLVETEYQRAVVAAELDYVRSLVADMASGKLTWSR